jgi:hypothetical protein
LPEVARKKQELNLFTQARYTTAHLSTKYSLGNISSSGPMKHTLTPQKKAQPPAADGCITTDFYHEKAHSYYLSPPLA